MDITTSSSTQEPKTITTLSRKEKLLAMQKSSENGSEVQESLATSRRVRRPERLRRSRRRRTHVKKVLKDVKNASNGGGEEDEKAEVEEKIMALQQIVPGGEELGVDKLFEKTAGYILALQFQVNALRVLTDIVEGSEKEKSKLGG